MFCWLYFRFKIIKNQDSRQERKNIIILKRNGRNEMNEERKEESVFLIKEKKDKKRQTKVV